jgi:hypothetical protein
MLIARPSGPTNPPDMIGIRNPKAALRIWLLGVDRVSSPSDVRASVCGRPKADPAHTEKHHLKRSLAVRGNLCVMSESAIAWEPIAGIESPCADISFSVDAGHLRVLMHFSHVKGRPDQDLELVFEGVIGLRWIPEHFGWILISLPKPLPKFGPGVWSGWSFPLLTIAGSKWMESFQQLPGSEGRSHFSLLAMNDELEFLAKPNVTAKWIVGRQGMSPLNGPT